jgi:hypothetical protein
MSSEYCYDYFESCAGVFEAFLSEMPARIQDKIRGRLRALAAVQAEEGQHHASQFALMVSGESPPALPQQARRPRGHLRLVK